MKKISFIIFILFFSSLIAETVSATTIISPLLEMSVDPGGNQKGILKVYNETDNQLTLTASIEPFKSADENGQPRYLAPSEKDVFLTWFNIGNEVLILKPKEVALVPFFVAPPLNAVPGGYYAVIFWRSGGVQDASVSVGSKVGTLIFLQINGSLEESGEIADFNLAAKSNFIFSLPLNFIVRFYNSGNIHLAPTGTIELRNWFGKETILNVNQDQKLILPGSIRRFDEVWHNLPASTNIWQSFWQAAKAEFDEQAFGPYSATLHLTYGAAEDKEIIQRFSFWIFPWHLILICVVLIIILVGFWKINKKANRLKKRKINQADAKKV